MRQVAHLCSLCESGRLQDAAALQSELSPIIRALFSESSPIPVKTALSLMGYCTDEMRLPLCSMGGDSRETLVREMERFGLL